MKRTILKSVNTLIYLVLFLLAIPALAQNIFSGEPVQVVGSFNGYVTTPYNADYRTCYYRRVSTPSGNPTDGRGQWVTNINVQNSGGNVTPVNMTGGGGNGFLFISGPLSNRFQNKWVFSGIGSGAVDAINTISAYNSGNDMGLNMSTTGQYNFVFNDCGYTGTNAKYYVGYTSSIVVQAFRTSQTFVNMQPVVHITTQGVPSPEQKIYVRYRADVNDFTSGTSVVQATGSGTSWSATLPAQACNGTVYYYVYSSTRTLAQIQADSESDRTLATLLWDDNNGNNYSFTLGFPTTYFEDLDGDGFGNGAVAQASCNGGPTGYVTNNTDCNDNQLQYLDADGDGFGSTTLVGCGVANNSDCNDNQIQYYDGDNDGYGSPSFVACGVTNNLDCNDNQLQYLDADGDGFGSTTLVGCGVANNSDCNDNQIQYYDGDNDGYGSASFVACGVTNNLDCNDNQLQYLDADGDGFGSSTLVGCGVANNSDCNDNQIQYYDGDNDGFGSASLTACGVTNNLDCNDNQLQYQDADGDGFGHATILVACGPANNTDCNDNQIQYYDGDNDGFGSASLVACGVTNNLDCNDNQLQYQDADGDGFGHATILVACGPANNSDCNDNQIQYYDGDNDGFGSASLVACGVTNNLDCNDNQLQYQDADGDGFGHATILVACGPANNSDCDDNQIQYYDGDNDGFGSASLVACGVTNNLDCNDNQLQYQDADGDGFGHATILAACGPANNSDCNDNQIQYYDGDNDGFGSASLVGCGVTNNSDCNDNALFYVDNDGDGLGSSVFSACSGVTNNSDCNDNDFLNLTGITFYQDADNDGYGNPAVTTSACVAPVGYVLNSLDCNDNNPAIHPGATEVCYDGIDNNCDGTIDEGCTPIVTVVQGAQCGSTLATIDQYVYANLVAGAQGYRFKVTDMTTNQVQTIDKALRVFQLTQLGSYAFNRTYQVEVSVRYANVWQPFYGLPCTVTTPATTTQIQAAQCGSTLTNMTDIIYANNVPFSAGYKFRITNLLTSAQQEIERPVRDIRMSTTAIAEYNTTYSIEVAVKNTNGSYLPYGTPCNVTTPSFPTSQLQLSQCDVIIANNATTIYADSYTGASTYRFRFTNGAFSYAFDRPTRSFVLSTVPGLLPATTYSVQVALEINGVFGPFGKVCTITTPGSARTVDVSQSSLQVMTYPNPFADNFKLDVVTTSEEVINVKVYDMLGKLVENSNVEANNIDTLEVGSTFPSGVYNVIVSQGNEVKTQRVIKR